MGVLGEDFIGNPNNTEYYTDDELEFDDGDDLRDPIIFFDEVGMTLTVDYDDFADATDGHPYLYSSGDEVYTGFSDSDDIYDDDDLEDEEEEIDLEELSPPLTNDIDNNEVKNVSEVSADETNNEASNDDNPNDVP